MVALTASHWVIAMRASADDDDSNRPLDPTAVVEKTQTYTDWDAAIAGYCMYRSVFKPEVGASNSFFTGKARNAPLVFARTVDAGATWTAAMMAPGQST
jgi:hypothetical protein